MTAGGGAKGSGAPPREYPTVTSATAATTRSSLDLLLLPYPFSQVGLLTGSEFVRLAEQRRSRAARGLIPPVNEQVLEELHQCGVLVPLFRVDLEPVAGAPDIDISDSRTAQQVRTTVVNELLRGAAEGRAVDPAAVGFEPWPRERQRTLWPSVASGYLYARHQLLGLDAAMSFVTKLKGERDGHTLTWHLPEAARPNTPTVEALVTWRSLAITLSALDTYYWPLMTSTVSHDFATWREVMRDLDPAAMRGWLDLSLDQIEGEITSLLTSAALRDDSGDFYELIRRAKADAWKSLCGDAASAMDFRLAADVLTRFAENLNPGGDYAAAQYAALSQQGLSARPESLDAALTDLRLSPFPALVIGVEGATEYLLVPRVMELLGIQWDHSRIRIVDFGGTDRDLALLARYAVEPILGRDFGQGVALDRPLTRFLVMTDAEHRYATAANRRYQRKLLLDSLTVNVPKDLRSDYYINTRRDRVVEIVTWGKLPFEFAHFTDRELADVMLSAAVVPYPHDRARLVRGIHMQRTNSAAPNVEEVFWRGSGLTKPGLAEALWPVLERKINTAIQQGKPGPPVMRACVRAYEMASASGGLSMMLRRRRWRTR
jgi:hypothetical protein